MVISETKRQSFSSDFSEMGSINTEGATSSRTTDGPHEGLGNQSMLEKIDRLRELNLGTIVPLPQVQYYEIPVC
jgi:hypothetical protein